MVLQRTPVLVSYNRSLFVNRPHLGQFLHGDWMGEENNVKSLDLAVQTNHVPAVEPPAIPFHAIAPGSR